MFLFVDCLRGVEGFVGLVALWGVSICWVGFGWCMYYFGWCVVLKFMGLFYSMFFYTGAARPRSLFYFGSKCLMLEIFCGVTVDV